MSPQDNAKTWPCKPTDENRPKQATSHDHATPRAESPRASRHAQPRKTKAMRPRDR